jgi:hypothetical protein
MMRLTMARARALVANRDRRGASAERSPHGAKDARYLARGFDASWRA